MESWKQNCSHLSRSKDGLRGFYLQVKSRPDEKWVQLAWNGLRLDTSTSSNPLSKSKLGLQPGCNSPRRTFLIATFLGMWMPPIKFFPSNFSQISKKFKPKHLKSWFHKVPPCGRLILALLLWGYSIIPFFKLRHRLVKIFHVKVPWWQRKQTLLNLAVLPVVDLYNLYKLCTNSMYWNAWNDPQRFVGTKPKHPLESVFRRIKIQQSPNALVRSGNPFLLCKQSSTGSALAMRARG